MHCSIIADYESAYGFNFVRKAVLFYLMPATNPYEHWPESSQPANTPEHGATGWYDQFLPHECRFYIRLERSIVLHALRSRIDELRPFMRQHGGSALFKTPLSDGERKTLITTDERVAGKNNTAIITNIVRPPVYGEPSFPDGAILEAANFYLPRSGRRFAYVHETLSRTRQEKGFAKTEFASTLLHRGENVTVWGGALENQLPPAPAGSLEGISIFSGYYWQAIDALRHCNAVAFEENAHHLRVSP